MSIEIQVGVLQATSCKVLVIFGGQYFFASFWAIFRKKCFKYFQKLQQSTSWGVQGYLQ